MAEVQVTISVPKEFHELTNGLVALIKTLKPSLADGLQITDTAAVIGAVMAFLPALKGVEQIDDEAKLMPGAFGIQGALLLEGIYSVVRA